MRFKNFINEVAKGPSPSTMDEGKAMVWMGANAQRFIEQIVDGEADPIWRGMDSVGNFAIGRTEFQRTASNTYNYVNLLVSNLPDWKKLPPRESSYIGTTDPSYAEGYGHVYLVVPSDSAKIGVVGQEDFWHAFDDVNEGFGDIQGLAEFIHSILTAFGKEMKSNRDYDELKKSLESITMNDVKELDLDNVEKSAARNIEDVMDFLDRRSDETDTMFEIISNLLDPDMAGMELEHASAFGYMGEGEVWIHGEVMFVHPSVFGAEEDYSKDAVQSWLEENVL